MVKRVKKSSPRVPLVIMRNPILDEPGDYELCCFCFEKTKFWHEGNDVACCQSCSKKYTTRDLPTKEEWSKAVRETGKLRTYAWP